MTKPPPACAKPALRFGEGRQIPLPGTLAEIARAVGRDAALEIARACGGQRLYIPLRPRRGNALVELVGLEATRTLAKMYGTERVLIPFAKNALIPWLRHKKERTVPEIRAELKVSERWIYVVLSGAPLDGRQFDLFRPSERVVG